MKTLQLTFKFAFSYIPQVHADEKLENPPYSLMTALDEGNFSDITIIAKNGKQVRLVVKIL